MADRCTASRHAEEATYWHWQQSTTPKYTKSTLFATAAKVDGLRAIPSDPITPCIDAPKSLAMQSTKPKPISKSIVPGVEQGLQDMGWLHEKLKQTMKRRGVIYQHGSLPSLKKVKRTPLAFIVCRHVGLCVCIRYALKMFRLALLAVFRGGGSLRRGGGQRVQAPGLNKATASSAWNGYP